MTILNQEIFKLSKKSICHGCINFNELCEFNVLMVCETDSKINKAYVFKCSSFNKNIKKKYIENTVAVDATTDSRIEMMGGGH